MSDKPCVVFITALQLEFNAVLAHLSSVEERTHPKGTVYDVGDFEGWQVALVEIGMGNPTAATETERAIEFFAPSHVFFVGVAGGIKDLDLGDVVAATKVYGYESGKLEGVDFKPRSDIGESSYAMTQRARATARKPAWLDYCIDKPESTPKAIVAPIAAGEKVIASKRSNVYQFLTSQYSDATAVEMEGIGFLNAVHANRIEAIIVRGIADLITQKTAKNDKAWQPIAAQNAAAFAFAMLAKLEKTVSSVMGSNESGVIPNQNEQVAYHHTHTARDTTTNKNSQTLPHSSPIDTTPDRKQILALLKNLLPGQFDEVVFNTSMPAHQFTGHSQGQKALELITFYEQNPQTHSLQDLLQIICEVAPHLK